MVEFQNNDFLIMFDLRIRKNYEFTHNIILLENAWSKIINRKIYFYKNGTQT